jgi:enediyne polyketide synthase
MAELRALGIEASVAIGHSLGELTTLCWAGVLTEDAMLRIAAERGRLMSEVRGIPGAMAGLGAGEEQTLNLIEGEAVVIGGLNSPRQTVISGESDAVRRVVERAQFAMAIQARLADRAAAREALPEPAVAVAQ